MNPSLRAAVIAEWRGLPDRKMRPDRWQSPTELMPKLMQRLGLRERLRETEVIDAWSKIVGDFIAAHSAPVALREGILYVRVLQPALHYELEQISKSEILRKLKQRFGSKTIRDVRFRVGWGPISSQVFALHRSHQFAKAGAGGPRERKRMGIAKTQSEGPYEKAVLSFFSALGIV